MLKQTLVVSLLLLAACESKPVVAPAIGNHHFGDSFSTPAGTTEMVGEKVLVSFLNVLEDSRCPKQVTCVWQGAVKVKVGVKVRDEPRPLVHRDVELSTQSESTRGSSIEGFRIELVDVMPYPETAGPIAPQSYSITLRVTRG